MHLIMVMLGVLAYTFANVDSQNGFFSLLLPTVLVFTILYLIALIIYLIHKARHPTSHNEHVGLLSEAVQELGKSSNNINLQSVLAKTSLDATQESVSQTTAIPPAVHFSASLEAGSSFVEEPDQDDINLDAWEDDANWTGPPWLAVYFSKSDSRSWVPKRIPLLGWTPNLGHSGGFLSWLIIWASITVVCVILL